MCGLYGFSRTTENTQKMNGILAYAMSMRGKDSWGVTDGTMVFKKVGDITDTFVEMNYDAPLYHTRAHSVGAVTHRNAHPFAFETASRHVIGAHNGFVSNCQALKAKYERKDAEVDSEHIFMHIAEGKPVEEIAGWGAVIWYETDKLTGDQVRYFSKFGNQDNLHFAQLTTGEIVFASTEMAIEMAARLAGCEVHTFYEVEEKEKYFIEQVANGRDELHMVEGGRLPWGEKAVELPHQVRQSFWPDYDSRGNHNGQRRYVSQKGAKFCPVGHCNEVIKDDQDLICPTCYTSLARDIYVTANAY